MPSRIQTPPQDLNPLSSATDQWIMAQEEFWGDESKNDASAPIVVAANGATSGGDFAGLQPLIVSANLQQSKELVEFMYKTGHAGATKKGPGPETIINGASFALTGDGTAIPLQMISQDKDPTFVYLGRLLSGAATSLVALGTSIAGNAAITPTNTLSGVSYPLEARILLTGAARSSTTQPSTLTIVGTDASGTAFTDEVEYETDADLASIYTTRPALTITSVTPRRFAAGSTIIVFAYTYTTRQSTTIPPTVSVATGVSCDTAEDIPFVDDLKTTEYPVRVRVVPQSGSALATGVIRATYTITGKGHNGNELEETVSFTGAGVPDDKTTFAFFSEISNMTASGWATGSTVNVRVRDRSTEVTFEPQDESLVAFASAEFTKGDVPFLYRSLCANSMTIGNPNRNSPLLAVIDFHGRKVVPYTNLAGTVGASANRTDATALAFAEPSIFIGWQQKMTVGGVEIPIIDMSHSINQNLQYSGVMTGTPFEEVRPYRSGKRSAMSEGNILFSKEQNIAQDYNENVTYEEVSVEWENIADGSFPNQLKIEYDEAQLQTIGDPASPEFDRLLLPFALMAFSSKFGTPTDFRIVAIYSEYDLVRQYA